jgi:uncharacterized LabA/DUF88 family protein
MSEHPKRTAILLDGGYVTHSLYRTVGNRLPTANEVLDFAHGTLMPREDLFRIYYYDCPPFKGSHRHPLSGKPIHFSETDTCKHQAGLQESLSLSDHVAFRGGELIFTGWTISERATREIIKTKRDLRESDLKPDLKQKRVDIKIGLDIAWLSSNAIVERIVLVTGDSDFVPAMKFARREGVQVIIVQLKQATPLRKELVKHADEVRNIDAEVTIT